LATAAFIVFPVGRDSKPISIVRIRHHANRR
jgi:hypothetical protein